MHVEVIATNNNEINNGNTIRQFIVQFIGKQISVKPSMLKFPLSCIILHTNLWPIQVRVVENNLF